MTIWTWWMPEKKAVDSVVETQDDDEKIPQHETAAGRRARLNRFYKRKQLRNKHICQLNSNGGNKCEE